MFNESSTLETRIGNLLNSAASHYTPVSANFDPRRTGGDGINPHSFASYEWQPSPKGKR